MTKRLLCVAALLFAVPVWAEAPIEPVTDIEEVSLEDLLETDTTVASARSVQLRASPGVVTVVGRDEIQRLGARDLLDLLPLVPGFDVGVDVLSVVGLSFRGNWAHEGKLLIMVDGVEMNEVLYQTAPMGGRFPLHDVERVEILRGPGSARYGGFAALAVINLVTRSGAQKAGVDAAATYGQNVTPFANQTINASAGQTLDVLGGLDLSVHAQVSERQRSDRDYVDVFGETWQMAGRSPLRNAWLNASAKTSWLKTRLLIDLYGVRGRDGFDEVLPTEALEGFPSFALDVQAPLALHPTLTLTPRIVLLRQLPWWAFEEDTPAVVPVRTVIDRGRVGVDVGWQAIPTVSIAAGIEGYIDAAREVPQRSQPAALDFVDLRFAGDGVTNFLNGAVYGDAQIETGLFTLTVGSRAELHSTYGPSMVPRVAITRVFPTGHLKLLVSGSFKAPSIANLQLNPDIRPERTRVVEGEAGLQLVEGIYVTVNAFDIEIRDPIVYFFNADINDDGYANFDRTGTRGVEGELRYATGAIDLSASYAFATAAGINTVPNYGVQDDPSRLLGMPTHKAVARATFHLSDRVTFTPSVVLRSERAAITSVDGDGNPIYGNLPASALVNAWLQVRDVAPGVNVGCGVQNLLGEDFRLAQPYNSLHAPLPAFDREVMVRIEGAMPL
jgi:outer membrane cobalamin receptor